MKHGMKALRASAELIASATTRWRNFAYPGARRDKVSAWPRLSGVEGRKRGVDLGRVRLELC